MWAPLYPYKVKNRQGTTEERFFHLREITLNECPVSFLSRDKQTRDRVTGPMAIRLMKLWRKAERQKTTLSDLLGSEEAWVEDVEETFATAQELLQAAYDKERDKRLS